MVCHFPVYGLVPAEPPAGLSDEYLREYSTVTSLLFRPFIDLPDTSSRVFQELGLGRDEAERYYRLRWDLSHRGLPDEVAHHCDVTSKLLGWPDLVQHDFDPPPAGSGSYCLLAQLPARMGPGGSLYFFIRDDDLTERRFDRCVIEEQNT
jgi:hypothetical protein